MTNAVDLKQILVIWRKELFELFRERRTVMAVVVGPLVITPLLFGLIGIMVNRQIKSESVKTYTIGTVNCPVETLKQLMPTTHLSLIEMSSDEAQSDVRNHKVSAAMVFPAGFASDLGSLGTTKIEILEDSGDSTSQDAVGRLQDSLRAASDFAISMRVRQRGLPPQFAMPFAIAVQSVKGAGSFGTLILSMMLPYILIISAFSGTIYAAFDQVAGEKERGTLETLLVSPVSRMSIVIGKFLTIVCVCLLSCILSMTGLAITFSVGAKFLGTLGSSAIKLSLPEMLSIAAALVPLAILFAGLLLTISITARNQKEAQTALAPLFTLVIMPAMSSMLINSGDISTGLALVPVLNAALIIKLALSNRFEPGFIAVAFGASIVYASLALIYAASLFQKESVLLKA